MAELNEQLHVEGVADEEVPDGSKTVLVLDAFYMPCYFCIAS